MRKRSKKTVAEPLTRIEELARSAAYMARDNFEAYPESYVNRDQALDEACECVSSDEGGLPQDEYRAMGTEAERLLRDWFAQAD